MAGQPAVIWDAESLIVFKLMFFRCKDVADVEGILRVQHGRLDLAWVRHWLVELYGPRDPRVGPTERSAPEGYCLASTFHGLPSSDLTDARFAQRACVAVSAGLSARRREKNGRFRKVRVDAGVINEIAYRLVWALLN